MMRKMRVRKMMRARARARARVGMEVMVGKQMPWIPMKDGMRTKMGLNLSRTFKGQN
jgi:hypothetical protein